MDTRRDQDLRIKLSGLLVRTALDSTLGQNDYDEIVVNAPPKNEVGEYLDPDWPIFGCHIKVDGQTFEFDVWPVFIHIDTVFHLNWRAWSGGSVLPLANGHFDDDSFRFELWGGREGFISALKEEIAAHEEHRARALGRTAIKWRNITDR